MSDLTPEATKVLSAEMQVKALQMGREKWGDLISKEALDSANHNLALLKYEKVT